MLIASRRHDIRLLMNPYSANWKIVIQSDESGGQGTISIVENLKEKGILGALKEIHIEQQKIKIKRERMCREINSLRKVAGNGVPKIYDDNSSSIDNFDIPLYFISEWIEGETLDKRFLRKPSSLEEAIRITRELSLIVDRCHQLDVLHRDIKPKNILITSSGKIFLVDFGLAWIEPISNEGRKFNSLSHEELSNWFLRLPELITGHEKHNKTSDVTYLVGIFFFLLTGQYPKSLTDGNGNPPQITLRHLFSKELIANKRWYLINSIFSVGFQPSVDHRLQSAIDLIKMLDEINNFQEKEEPALDSNVQVQKLQGLLNETSLKTKTLLLENFAKINNDMMTKFSDLGKQYNLSTPCNNSTGQNFRAFNMYFRNENLSSIQVVLNHKLELLDDVGTKMIATYKIENAHPKIYYEGYSTDNSGLISATNKIINELFPLVAESYTNKTKIIVVLKYKYYRAYRPDGIEKEGVNRIEFNSNGDEITRQYIPNGLPTDEPFHWATLTEINKNGIVYPNIQEGDLTGLTKK